MGDLDAIDKQTKQTNKQTNKRPSLTDTIIPCQLWHKLYITCRKVEIFKKKTNWFFKGIFLGGEN